MNDTVLAITAMGFEPGQVQRALELSQGNQERAVDLLLSGDLIAGETSAEETTRSAELIQTDISQYSVEHGRSACTCIALTGAAMLLDQAQNQQISPEFLKTMITQGVVTYENLNRAVEHMSAEEVLQQQSPNLPLEIMGGVRQGFLSLDEDHPLGLKVLLRACQSEGAKVVLITKTPESVVVCLSPIFCLVDSHPRPYCSNAYAQICQTVEELVGVLRTIFPPTDLGPDVPEMMTMMYNSFDLYPLTQKR